MKGFVQLARFALVATLNLGVNLAVLAVGVHALHLPERLGRPGLWLAQGVAVLAATSLGYVLHARFTFRDGQRAAGAGRVGRYGAVAAGALAVQVPLFAVVVEALGRFWSGAALPFVANVLVGVLIFAGSFLLNRIWTFQAHHSDHDG